MRGKIFIMTIALFLSLYSGAGEKVMGKTAANSLNVRVQPSISQTVVAKIAKDAEVEILSVKKGWYEIAAPNDCAVWIAASDLSPEGTVMKETYLRSGTGVTYSPFSRKALKGEKLNVLEKREDWVKISPPQNLSAWVSAEFISAPPGGIPNISEDSADAENLNTDTSDKKEKDMPPPPEFTAVPASDASYEGILLPLSKDAVHATHAIVMTVNGTYAAICYLSPAKINFKLWENQKVHVSGKERWVKGWKRPLLTVESINPAETQTE